MAWFARIRLITAIAGGVNLALLLFILAAPYWRTSLVIVNVEALNGMKGYEGLWMECFTFYLEHTQCTQIGSMSNRHGAARTVYYSTGVYDLLTIFRVLMVIAFVSEIAAFCCSLLGMKCTKFFKEGGSTKRWMNTAAGVCHLVTGVLTVVTVSWYTSEVVREYSSPYYLTNRVKYTLGGCLYIGWISTVASLVLGSVLTICTFFNQPLDTSAYTWKTLISEVEIPPPPTGSVMAPPEAGTYHDDVSGYTSKRSHRPHKSHRSHRSHTSHGSRHSSNNHRDHGSSKAGVANLFETESYFKGTE